jgi:predicted phage terminase large subunit-like protein
MDRQIASEALTNAARVLRRATAQSRRLIEAKQVFRLKRAMEIVSSKLAIEEGERAKEQQSDYGWYDDNGVRQGGLIAFVRYFWKELEPETPFVDGWPLWAMAEHLEAVTRGDITRLLINIPPGCMKSLLVNVFWPAWEWGPMGKSHFRYVTFSYSASLTERDNGKFRDLVTCESYQRLYGGGDKGVRLRNKTTLKVHNTRTGWKLASSVGGVGTGERGDRIILDDPHNVKDAESETVRNETTRWFRESLSSRFNNAQTAFVVIMQRVNEDDVSGVILSNERSNYTHLMIPMKYDWERQTDAEGRPITTDIDWFDPRWVDPEEAGSIDAAQRQCDETLAWPERFEPSAVDQLEADLGPYAFAGQYLQAPAPRGGGLFKRDWWQLWDPEDGKFPPCDYLVASLDSAFTEDQQNDPSALTIWGVFEHPELKKRRIILVHAWRKHLQFSGPRFERTQDEIVTPGMAESMVRFKNAKYRQRTQPHWGLIEWVRDTCLRFPVHKLLIEGKASGLSACQELRNRYGDEGYAIEVCPVKGDKYARALAVQATFSNMLVYAPERDWSEMVIDEMGKFPNGKHDDLTDSTTQAISHLRARGLASTDEETTAMEMQQVMHRGRPPAALYPV